MDNLARARAHRDAGRPRDALAVYARLVEQRPDPGVLTEAAEVALGVDPSLAEALARRSLEAAPNLALAAHQLAEAWARLGRLADARELLRAAVTQDGRLADLRHPGARPWTERAPEAPCPACETPGGELVFVGNATRVQTVFNQLDPVKAWVRCGSCGLVRQPDPPSDEALGRYYAAQRGSAQGVAPPDGRAVTQECLTWEPVLQQLERAIGGAGTLLEVGSAWGVFLAAAQWRGWDVRGLELSAPAAAHAQRTFGVPVDAARVPEELPDATFDAVVLWEVIEHFRRPDEALSALARRVRPGGVLALSTPDLDHPAHRALGADDPMWSVPGHLVYYDRRTLDAAIVRAGLQVEARWFSARHVGSVGVIARRPA